MGGIGSSSLGPNSSRQCLHFSTLLSLAEIGSGFQPATADHAWCGQWHRWKCWSHTRYCIQQAPALGHSSDWRSRLLLWLWCPLACCQPHTSPSALLVGMFFLSLFQSFCSSDCLEIWLNGFFFSVIIMYDLVMFEFDFDRATFASRLFSFWDTTRNFLFSEKWKNSYEVHHPEWNILVANYNSRVIHLWYVKSELVPKIISFLYGIDDVIINMLSC